MAQLGISPRFPEVLAGDLPTRHHCLAFLRPHPPPRTSQPGSRVTFLPALVLLGCQIGPLPPNLSGALKPVSGGLVGVGQPWAGTPVRQDLCPALPPACLSFPSRRRLFPSELAPGECFSEMGLISREGPGCLTMAELGNGGPSVPAPAPASPTARASHAGALGAAAQDFGFGGPPRKNKGRR